MADTLIDGLMTLKSKLQAIRDTAKRDFDEADRKLQAVTTTLAVLMEENAPRPAAQVGIVGVDRLVEELRTKKTQLQGLIAIARRNGGMLYTKDAKHLLQRSGLMSQTKNASNILYNVINRSERFRHIKAGEYQLIESIAPKMESVSSAGSAVLFPPKPPVQ